MSWQMKPEQPLKELLVISTLGVCHKKRVLAAMGMKRKDS
jgi:hypothetical protein